MAMCRYALCHVPLCLPHVPIRMGQGVENVSHDGKHLCRDCAVIFPHVPIRVVSMCRYACAHVPLFLPYVPLRCADTLAHVPLFRFGLRHIAVAACSSLA